MRRLFIHRVDVERHLDTITDKVRDKGFRPLHREVQCLVEPRPSIELESKLGRISKADHLMTWATEDIRANDRVIWGGQTFTVKRVVRDTARPFSSIPAYNVAELEEKIPT